MKDVTIPAFWELKARAKKYYPNSAYMRVQWLRKTVHLYSTGKHVLLTGKFAGGRA
jgi:hypothetical protein